jgi:hypothetical protein
VIWRRQLVACKLSEIVGGVYRFLLGMIMPFWILGIWIFYLNFLLENSKGNY